MRLFKASTAKAAGAFCFASKPLRRAGGWGSLQPFTLASCRGRATSKRTAPAQRLARVVRPHELRPHLRVMAGPEGKQAGNLPRLSAASDCPFIHRHARLGVRCGWLFCRDQHRPLLSARITPKLPPCDCVTARFAQHITKPPRNARKTKTRQGWPVVELVHNAQVARNPRKAATRRTPVRVLPQGAPLHRGHGLRPHRGAPRRPHQVLGRAISEPLPDTPQQRQAAGREGRHQAQHLHT